MFDDPLRGTPQQDLTQLRVSARPHHDHVDAPLASEFRDHLGRITSLDEDLDLETSRAKRSRHRCGRVFGELLRVLDKEGRTPLPKPPSGTTIDDM